MTTDGAQNRWVATHQALYLLRPGDKTFHRYDARDGLHLAGNPVTYCDTWAPRPSCLSGAAVSPGITEITGGGPGEVFVGYAGHDDGTEDFNDPNRHTGKLDRVRVDASGAIAVQRLDLVNSSTAQFWHDRTVQRLVYDRARKELYVGTNHGIDRLQPDRYRDPKPGEWFLNVTHEWLSDHLHPRVCFHAACTGDESKDDQRMGDWRGIALAPDGDLWVAGKWTAGKIRWTSDLSAWHARPGHEAYAFNFGDPYDPSTGANPPVFKPPREGDPVSMSAVAVAKDGTVWFASDSLSRDPSYGLASFDGKSFHYFAVRTAGVSRARDLVALPDGRVAIASPVGISLWDPSSGKTTLVAGSALLPSDDVVRLELDTSVDPPSLHVSTSSGAAVLRVLP
ncbi:MAG: WD40 repeat domain-containing protein [Myxococcales bacterium]